MVSAHSIDLHDHDVQLRDPAEASALSRVRDTAGGRGDLQTARRLSLGPRPRLVRDRHDCSVSTITPWLRAGLSRQHCSVHLGAHDMHVTKCSVQGAEGCGDGRVKSCQSLVNEREEVRSGRLRLTSLAAKPGSVFSYRCTVNTKLSPNVRFCKHRYCSDAAGLRRPRWASCRVEHTAQARFHREVAILKACRNRNIVSFLGQFAHAQHTWLIMEYMEVCHGQYRWHL